MKTNLFYHTQTRCQGENRDADQPACVPVGKEVVGQRGPKWALPRGGQYRRMRATTLPRMEQPSPSMGS